MNEFMNVLLTGWAYLLIIFNLLAPYLKAAFSSPLVAAITTAAVAAYFGIRSFLTQQRISRIQKIYYEESLLDLLKHMDRSLNTTVQSYSTFLTAMNLMSNNINPLNVINPVIADSLTDLATQIQTAPSYLSSKREVLILLFGKRGYKIQQWLFKFDRDISEFNSFVREILLRFRTENIRSEVVLQNQITEVTRNFDLIRRHFTLPYLFNEIVSIVGIYDFKSRNALIKKIKYDRKINEYLNRIDEAFKTLFGWYDLSNNEYLSYLSDETGNRFILRLDQPELEATRTNPPEIAQMRIISNDVQLARYNITIGNITRPYAFLQMGIANLIAFDEKPHFYPEARSFTNFV